MQYVVYVLISAANTSRNASLLVVERWELDDRKLSKKLCDVLEKKYWGNVLFSCA